MIFYNKTKSNRKKGKNSKKRMSKKNMKRGGLVVSKYDKYYIENTEIILFLIDFLSKTDLKTILVIHHKFINSIDPSKPIDFKENKELRAFVNDMVQWFLLDYDKQFSNALLEIVKNTLENPNFLNKNVDSNQRYNVLLDSVYNMIDQYSKSDDINIFMLLEIILRALQMPNIKDKIMTILISQEASLISFKKTILCLLDFLIKDDLFHNEEIRKLVKEFIEEFSYNNAYSWTTLKKLAALVKQCSITITGDVSSMAAKKVYNSTIGKLF